MFTCNTLLVKEKYELWTQILWHVLSRAFIFNVFARFWKREGEIHFFIFSPELCKGRNPDYYSSWHFALVIKFLRASLHMGPGVEEKSFICVFWARKQDERQIKSTKCTPASMYSKTLTSLRTCIPFPQLNCRALNTSLVCKSPVRLEEAGRWIFGVFNSCWYHKLCLGTEKQIPPIIACPDLIIKVLFVRHPPRVATTSSCLGSVRAASQRHKEHAPQMFLHDCEVYFCNPSWQ